jgi:hypothetical protein
LAFLGVFHHPFNSLSSFSRHWSRENSPRSRTRCRTRVWRE